MIYDNGQELTRHCDRASTMRGRTSYKRRAGRTQKQRFLWARNPPRRGRLRNYGRAAVGFTSACETPAQAKLKGDPLSQADGTLRKCVTGTSEIQDLILVLVGQNDTA